MTLARNRDPSGFHLILTAPRVIRLKYSMGWNDHVPVLYGRIARNPFLHREDRVGRRKDGFSLIFFPLRLTDYS